MADKVQQLKDLASFAAGTTAQVLAGKPVKVSPTEATRRYQLCSACPFFNEPKCTKCGCRMGIKVQWSAARCADVENPRW